MYRKIAESEIGALLQNIASHMALYLPLREGTTTDFGLYNTGKDNTNFGLNCKGEDNIGSGLSHEDDDRGDFGQSHAGGIPDFDTANTSTSVKKLFFPQAEDIVDFKTDSGEISVNPAQAADEPFAVFAVRTCDAYGLEVLDSVFLSEPADSFYAARRKHGILIVMGCDRPDDTCFCGAFGIDPLAETGDVAIRLIDGFLYWCPLTEKGERLTESATGDGSLLRLDEKSIRGITQQEDATENRPLLRSAVERQNEASRKIHDKLRQSFPDLTGFISENGEDKTAQFFDSKKWEELSAACIGCGSCTFVCPTCQCYDIRDEDKRRADGSSVTRYRCWDSCMYSDFTMMAHGNPRESQKERFRQRFMHKLVYYPAENDGKFSCVGCGRCLRRCPISMNIVKVIRALGEESNV